MPKAPSEKVTPREAARILKTHVSTVYRLILHGRIPARRVNGHRYQMLRADVVKYAEGEVVVPTKRVEWVKDEGAG